MCEKIICQNFDKYLQILKVRQTVKIRNTAGRNTQRCHYSEVPQWSWMKEAGSLKNIKYLGLYKWMKYTRISLLDIHNNVIEFQLLGSFYMLITIEEKN